MRERAGAQDSLDPPRGHPGEHSRRGARAAESARLESVCGATHRGFESHSLRVPTGAAPRLALARAPDRRPARRARPGVWWGPPASVPPRVLCGERRTVLRIGWEPPLTQSSAARARSRTAIRLVGAVVTLVAVAAACGHAKRKISAVVPTTAPPTTVATTTAPPPPPVFPLTGLPTSAGPAVRPALSVKVDNVTGAFPQAGLNDADIVTEELVEGGQTRLFVTYQSRDADRVGPIRSARPVDADLLSQLGGGVFAYSGAAPGEIAPVEDHSGATLLSMDGGVGAFYRDRSRPAPHNV